MSASESLRKAQDETVESHSQFCSKTVLYLDSNIPFVFRRTAESLNTGLTRAQFNPTNSNLFQKLFNEWFRKSNSIYKSWNR